MEEKRQEIVPDSIFLGIDKVQGILSEKDNFIRVHVKLIWAYEYADDRIKKISSRIFIKNIN